MSLDPAAIKRDFPIFDQRVNGNRLVYVDSASTSQKPRAVIDAMSTYYETINANVHRGVYTIAELATNQMEDARRAVAAFVGGDYNEVVFTKNATESLNLVAYSWGRANLQRGDVVVLTEMEHHANIVPWHMLAAERGIELRWLPIDHQGSLCVDSLEQYIDGAKLVSITAASNVLGTLTPVRRIADVAHQFGATVCIDACQSVPHMATDVRELGADLLAFSGHKMCGPTGVGVLWAKADILERMPPFLGGGEMIRDVRFDGFTTNDIPWKFEAGTPPIAEIIGLGAAVKYLQSIGMEQVREHEMKLAAYTLRTLSERFGDELQVFGPPEPSQRGAVFSFTYRDVHPHDISQVLDQHGVCVRAGHHCAKPLMRRLGINATARASLYIYNDETDVDAFADALQDVGSFFG